MFHKVKKEFSRFVRFMLCVTIFTVIVLSCFEYGITSISYKSLLIYNAWGCKL